VSLATDSRASTACHQARTHKTAKRRQTKTHELFEFLQSRSCTTVVPRQAEGSNRKRSKKRGDVFVARSQVQRCRHSLSGARRQQTPCLAKSRCRGTCMLPPIHCAGPHLILRSIFLTKSIDNYRGVCINSAAPVNNHREYPNWGPLEGQWASLAECKAECK
jgi:hypothetical protein